MNSYNDTRIYVGNLPPDVREKDVQDVFWKYGSIKHVTLKNQRGPPFAFVEFRDHRDAEDAVNGRSGYNFDGYKLRVEHPKSVSSAKRPHCISTQQNASEPHPKQTKYRVIVTGLPSSGSWQDLKDHMREAGDVCFADVDKTGCGVVEYQYKEDVKYAVRQLDNTKFKSHKGESSYVRVRADDETRRSLSRSPKPSPSLSTSSSRSRSPYSPGNSSGLLHLRY